MSNHSLDLTQLNIAQFVSKCVELSTRSYRNDTKYRLYRRDNSQWIDDPSGAMEFVENRWIPYSERTDEETASGTGAYRSGMFPVQIRDIRISWGLTYSTNYGTSIDLSTEVGEALAKVWKHKKDYNGKELAFDFTGYRDLTSVIKLLGAGDAKTLVADAKAKAEKAAKEERAIYAMKNIKVQVEKLQADITAAMTKHGSLVPTPTEDLAVCLASYVCQLEALTAEHTQTNAVVEGVK